MPKSKSQKTELIFNHDLEKCKNGVRLICGVDEAGRGPLAGPLVCAAAIMPLDSLIDGIYDSKELSEQKREALYEQITKKAIAWSVAIISEKIIDEINIYQATKKGMAEAVNTLKIQPDFVLVDAVKNLDIKPESLAVIKGDQKSYNIAAASILAKVTRDRIMQEYDKLHPEYLWKKNKGYATKEHITALKKEGASLLHRRSFIKNFFLESEGQEKHTQLEIILREDSNE